MRVHGEQLITFDYNGPIDALVDYYIKCLKTPLNYSVSCNFGLDAAQATKETVAEYITFLSRMGRTDIAQLLP